MTTYPGGGGVLPGCFVGGYAGPVSDVLSIAKVAAGGEAYYLGLVAGTGQGPSRTGSDRTDSQHAGPDAGPGLWLGGGTAQLGLEGLVVPVHLTSLLAGHDPLSGEVLDPRHANRVKVAAFDLTFAAPKSVSLIFGLGNNGWASEARAGHLAAVRGALRYMETRGMAARRTLGGQRRQIPVSGALAAGFTHAVSRRLDPHLHTHVLVANLVEGVDGRWSALDARGLYLEALTAGYLYQAHLRSELTERLGVGWTPVHKGTADVKGVDPEVIAGFSSRKAEIERHLAERGLSGSRSRKIAAAVTRPAKDTEVTLDELRTRWIERAGRLGLDVAAIVPPPARSRSPSGSFSTGSSIVTRRASGNLELREVPAGPEPLQPDRVLSLQVTALLALRSGELRSGEHGRAVGEPGGPPGEGGGPAREPAGGVPTRATNMSHAAPAARTAAPVAERTESFTRSDVVRAWCSSLPSGAPVKVIEEHARRYLTSGMVMKLPEPSGEYLQPAQAGLPGTPAVLAAARWPSPERWAVPRTVAVLVGEVGAEHLQNLFRAVPLDTQGGNLHAGRDARSRRPGLWRESEVLMAEAWDPVARIAQDRGLLPGAVERGERLLGSAGATGAQGGVLPERSAATSQGATDLLGVITSGAELAGSRALSSLCGELDSLRSELTVALRLGPVKSAGASIEAAVPAGAKEPRERRALLVDLHTRDLARYAALCVGVEVRSSMLAMSAMARPPSHLLERLGPVPSAGADRDLWYRAARSVESYRERWGVGDVANELGTPAGSPARGSRGHFAELACSGTGPSPGYSAVRTSQRASVLRALEGAARRLAPGERGARAAGPSVVGPGELAQENLGQRARRSLGLRAGRDLPAGPERDFGRGR